MRVLVTRPVEDAAPVAELLRARGVEPVIEPMLAINTIAGASVRLAGVQAVLCTSANGVRGLARANERRDVPLFAVGDATARAARDHGYASVFSAQGDVEDLAHLVECNLDPKDGPLLHAAGRAVAGDLAARLQGAGFSVRRAVLYEATPAESLSAPVTTMLHQGDIGFVLFFSPRTATTFVTLATKAGLAASCRKVAAVCLSPAVAKAAAGLPWREIRTAPRPELPALMEEMDAALAGAR